LVRRRVFLTSSCGDQARARGDARRGRLLADAVRAPPGGPVPGGTPRGAHDGACRGPGAGLHVHRYVRDGCHPPDVLRENHRPLGDPLAGPDGREVLLQEERIGAGEAQAFRGQALAPGDACDHRRADA
ncbi:unnamed protein product, partial [Ectocarpus sp. 12 AP-2014]